MGIYRGSRYSKTPLLSREGAMVFKTRKRYDFDLTDSILHEVQMGDTLDGLAYKYYKDSQLYWVILEVNPIYDSPLDIKVGDILVLPRYAEVVKVYE